jgi:Fe-S-cluster containining protein
MFKGDAPSVEPPRTAAYHGCMHPLAAAMSDAWQIIAPRFAAYELVVPGAPSFRCLTRDCTEHCCNRYTVNLSERDLARLTRLSGVSPPDFLECEDGKPIILPLAQPYVLARAEGTCVFLQSDLTCGQYEGRPNACRLYPHFVLFVDPASGRPVYGDVSAIEESFARWLRGERGALVPVLTRHLACPGFRGPPLPEDEWREILLSTARIQYAPDSSYDWPMPGATAGVTIASEARFPS